eukprot:scaffold313569_cov40-Prasinocladus_malaysianus.AAC.2
MPQDFSSFSASELKILCPDESLYCCAYIGQAACWQCRSSPPGATLTTWASAALSSSTAPASQ